MNVMKSLTSTIAVITLMAAVLVLPAQGEVLFDYNFNSLTYGPAAETQFNDSSTNKLTGQDGWALYSTKLDSMDLGTKYSKAQYLAGCYPIYGMEVVYPAPDTINNSVVIKHGLNWNNSPGFAGNWKNIGSFTFTSADTAIEQYAMVRPGDLKSMFFGFEFEGQFDNSIEWTQYSGGWGKMKITIDALKNKKIAWVDALGNETSYDSKYLFANDWYELKGVMDFSVLGGQITMHYRDVTAGMDWVEAFTAPMGLKPTYDGGEPTYTISSIGIMSQARAGSVPGYELYYDNFRLVNPIPEPSTLALLAAGMIGLLCYAWRKRR